jgi:basic membrane protein A
MMLTQSDLEGLQGVAGRPNCTICMNWLAEGVLPELTIPPMP